MRDFLLCPKEFNISHPDASVSHILHLVIRECNSTRTTGRENNVVAVAPRTISFLVQRDPAHRLGVTKLDVQKKP